MAPYHSPEMTLNASSTPFELLAFFSFCRFRSSGVLPGRVKKERIAGKLVESEASSLILAGLQ
jgi:hypothetical protein